MPPFFFKKRPTSSSSTKATQGEPPAVKQAQHTARIKHQSHVYAPSNARPAAFSARYSFGDLPKPETMIPDIMPLQPSRRRNRPAERAMVKTEFHKSGHGQDENFASLPFPYAGSPSGTFGRPTIREKTMASLKNNTQPQSSQQHQYQPRSRASSHSDKRSDTPTSIAYSQYNSSSSVVAPRHNEAPTSPSDTFGIRTPARSLGPARRIKVNEIFFSHLETPPPLPPLNHPAFLQSGQIVLPTSQSSSGGLRLHSSHFEIPRHSQSMPSIRRVARNPSSATGSTRPRRRGSKSSFVSKLEGQSKVVESARKGHTRSESKGSLKSNLSRRSSAEFSAKQASFLDSKVQESWEAQVSKELLRLSFGQDIVASGGHPAARGSNRAYGESGEVRGLGPPFSFQNTSSPNQDQSPYPAPAASRADTLSRIPPSTDSAVSVTSMSESIGASSSKGILNPSTGKFKPKSNYAPRRQARSNSSPDRTRTPSPPPQRLTTISSISRSGKASSSLLAPPILSFTAPTPEASPISPKRTHHKSTPTHPSAALQPPTPPSVVQKSHSSGSSKRKAEDVDVDVSPPREHRTTFAPEPRTHRASATSSSSHAPSSFHRNKRPRTSLQSDSQTFAKSAIPPLLGESPNAKSTGSWSSKASKTSTNNPQRASRPPSTKEASNQGHAPRQSSSRRSISQASIPMSAFMSPHAPSISRSSTFHMRDPRKPSRIQATPWSLTFPEEGQEGGGGKWTLKGWTDRGGSPLHAWLFFIGFIIFPLWFFAGFIIPIPRTRRLEGGEAEKGVILDDPQVEHDYKSWRRRCRIMAGVSIVTYIPFIVLVAIYA